jgi:type IV secretion system protein TrbL
MIKFLDIKKTPVKICLYFLIIAGFLIFFKNLAIAADIDQSILGDITQKYKDVGSSWGENVKTHALWLLKWLLVIQLVVMAVRELAVFEFPILCYACSSTRKDKRS